MLEADSDILRFVPNYPLHLIAPADIADEDFGKFHTELNLAVKYVKYSRDKRRLNEIVHEDSGYRSVSKKTADMVNIVTGSKLKYAQREENVNMCLAIEEMRKDAIAEGEKKGREEGRSEGVFDTPAGLVRDGILTRKQAADRAGLTVREFEEKAGLQGLA